MVKKKLLIIGIFLAILVSLIIFLHSIFGIWNFTCLIIPCKIGSIAVPTLSVSIREDASKSDIQQLINYVKSQHLQIGNDDINVIASSHFFYIIHVPREKENAMIIMLTQIPSVKKVDKFDSEE